MKPKTILKHPRRRQLKPEPFHAPYEKKVGAHIANPDHGGYGVVLLGSFMIGPFFDYDNAVKLAEKKEHRNADAKVVRWADFCKDTTAKAGWFRDLILTSHTPLTVQILGYKKQVHIGSTHADLAFG